MGCLTAPGEIKRGVGSLSQKGAAPERPLSRGVPKAKNHVQKDGIKLKKERRSAT